MSGEAERAAAIRAENEAMARQEDESMRREQAEAPPGPGLTFVRWRLGEDRVGRIFPPVGAEHPFHRAPCPVCDTELGERDVALMVLGVLPEDLAEKANGAARWYNAVAIAEHAGCALPGYVEGSLTNPNPA